MANIPSMGDVLMLSHTAKGIGKSFGIRAPGVPQDFYEVERETEGLADALKLLAYTLEDHDMIMHAPFNIQDSVFVILASTQTTLRDLAAFVEKYSTYSRVPGLESGEKFWSKAALEDWRRLPFAAQGGDISTLRVLLMMHCTTITLTTQALQSHSLERLEKTCTPISRKLEAIQYDRSGRINQHLDELHLITMTIMHEQRALTLMGPGKTLSPHVQDFDLPTPVSPLESEVTLSDVQLPSLQAVEELTAAPVAMARAHGRTQSHGETISQIYVEKRPGGWKIRKRPSSQALERDDMSRPPSSVNLGHQRRRSRSAESPSTPRFPFLNNNSDESPVSPIPSVRSTSSEYARESSLLSRKLQKHRSRPSSFRRKSMPLPDDIDFRAHGRTELRKPLVPPSTVEEVFADHPPQLPTPPRSRSSTNNLLEPVPSEAVFMENLLKDTIKMFDERGQLVEALTTVQKPDCRSSLHVSTVISKACRILVLKRRMNVGIGSPWTTSIWIIAADFSARLELPLHNLLTPRAIAPHISAKVPERVALTLPSNVFYHTPVWGCPAEGPGTALFAERVTYTFLSARAASRFQSVIFGQRLIDTFRIDRAVVLRPSGSGFNFFSKMLGSEEQICGHQRVRLWEDTGDATPTNMSGGVLGLMHVQPSFGQGWIQWWVNSSKVAHIKSKGNCVVEIRGIDCSVRKPNPRPLQSVDQYTQCSLVAGVPVAAFEQQSARPSFERPSTSGSSSNRRDDRPHRSPSPTAQSVKSHGTARPTSSYVEATRSGPQPSTRTSESRSRSGSRNRIDTPSPAPADKIEPRPHVAQLCCPSPSIPKPMPRSQRSFSDLTAVKALPSTPAYLNNDRVNPLAGLAPPPVPGKWDNPISPRSVTTRKSSETARRPSRPKTETSSARSESATPSPPPPPAHLQQHQHQPTTVHGTTNRTLPSLTTNMTTTTRHARKDSRLDRAEPRFTPTTPSRDQDSMSVMSQRSTTKMAAAALVGGFRKSMSSSRRSMDRGVTTPPTTATSSRRRGSAASSKVSGGSGGGGGGGGAAMSGLEAARAEVGDRQRGAARKMIHGMRIYFSSEDDKRRFLACVARARERMLPLPDL